MSPRELRKALLEKRWTSTATSRNLPEPPQEWREWRRRRMAVAIRCAGLFLFHGYTWREILARVREKQGQFVEPDMSRQRISQYTTKGTKFLLSRGVFEQARPSLKKRAREATLAPEKPKRRKPTLPF